MWSCLEGTEEGGERGNFRARGALGKVLTGRKVLKWDAQGAQGVLGLGSWGTEARRRAGGAQAPERERQSSQNRRNGGRNPACIPPDNAWFCGCSP